MSKQQPQFDSGLSRSFDGMNFSSDQKSSPKPEAAAEEPRSPSRRWEIQHSELKFGRSLGKGAYGEVFEGQYRKSKVAIKVYDFSGRLSVQDQKEVLHEADLMESLRSEYLAGFRGVCLDPRYCLVMEYCEGGSLRARLNQQEVEISFLDQLRWATQISYGVYQLHTVRILHRDLKGDNILLDKQGDAKIADFGLSVMKSSSSNQSKKSGYIAGTLPWMAPELFQDEPHTAASDIYSLGIVLWEIMSRNIPFLGKMPAVIIALAIANKRPSLPEKCPDPFQRLIQACWDADPLKRPTAETVGDQFNAALHSIQHVPPVPPKPVPEEQHQPKKKQEPKTSAPSPPAKNSSAFMPAPKPDAKSVDAKEVAKLLQLVVEGEQDQAEAMIKQKPELLLASGEVKDLSDRTFKKITAFQYALWALDWHMWKMILKYIPQELAMQQLSDLESKGTEYGRHFSLDPLTQALQKYVDNYKGWSYEECESHWCRVVGGAQRDLPTHVVNEYCREDRAFDPCPSFSEEKLPRIRTSKYGIQGDWFTAKSQGMLLGHSFAFHRAYSEGAAGVGVAPGGMSKMFAYEPTFDLLALQTLSKTRTQQFTSLKSQLLSAAPAPGLR